MTIGERIKQRREELNLSQDELAKRLGYKSRSSINKIELGHYNLRQSKIKAIADALDTTPSFIMGWDEEKEAIANEAERRTAAVKEMYKAYCGEQAYGVIEKFLLLDDADRGRIAERIDTLLEDDKYSVQEEFKRA